MATFDLAAFRVLYPQFDTVADAIGRFKEDLNFDLLAPVGCVDHGGLDLC